MKDVFKRGVIVAVIYAIILLAVIGINFFIKTFLGDSPISILINVPTIIISLVGIFLSPILLPDSLCNPSGFMGCESSFGQVFSIFINIVFFFIVGCVLEAIIKRTKN